MRFASKISESSNFFRIGFFTSFIPFLMSINTAAQGIQFELVTGTQKYDDAKCVIQTLDSGYIVLGSTSAFGNGQSDIYLTRISKTGTVDWQKAIGGPGVEHGNCVLQTSDSGFAIAGYSNSNGNGGYDVFLARTNKYGDLLWSNNYGGMDWDFGNYLIQTSSGDFVICGNTYSYGNGNGDVYLLKTDSLGVMKWDSTYGGSLEDVGNSVSEAVDGGYFISGYTKSFGAGNEDVFAVKTDSDGQTAWTRTFGGTGEEKGNECKATTDGKFIVICQAKSFSPNDKYENWLMKVNMIGDTLWSRRDVAVYNRISTSVSQTKDGGYIFTGHDDNAGQYSMFLYKTDGGGYYQDYRVYGGAQTENAFSVKQTYDKGYVVVGTTESYGTGKPNIYVLKTDSNRISTGTVQIVVGMEETKNTPKNISVFPNPAKDHFVIRIETRSELTIYDQTGRIVQTSILERGINNISCPDLTDGIYLILLHSKDETASAKIIIRH